MSVLVVYHSHEREVGRGVAGRLVANCEGIREFRRGKEVGRAAGGYEGQGSVWMDRRDSRSWEYK